MKSYDAIITFNPEMHEEKINAIVSKVEAKIQSLGGEVTKTEKWGMKKMAFSPKKAKGVKEGYYVAIFFKGEGAVPIEVRNILRVTEGVIRYLITVSNEVRLEMPPQGKEEKVEIASAMLEGPKS